MTSLGARGARLKDGQSFRRICQLNITALITPAITQTKTIGFVETPTLVAIQLVLKSGRKRSLALLSETLYAEAKSKSTNVFGAGLFVFKLTTPTTRSR